MLQLLVIVMRWLLLLLLLNRTMINSSTLQFIKGIPHVRHMIILLWLLRCCCSSCCQHQFAQVSSSYWKFSC